MKPIRVHKADLITKIQENRDAHRVIFEEAVEGYTNQSLEILGQHITDIQNGKMVRIHVSLPYPEDHTADYDRVLSMLDMSLDFEVEIEENDYASYVLDDWHWKRAFLTANARYSATAFYMAENAKIPTTF